MINRIKEHKFISVIFIIFFVIAVSGGTDSLIGFLFLCGIIVLIAYFRGKIKPKKKGKVISETTFKSEDGLLTVKMTEYEDEYEPLPPINDQRKAECPYCKKSLDKIPGKKKKCPHCSKYMFVRTGIDRVKKVVTEKEANEIDMLKIAQPYMDDGSFQKEQARLRKQFGGEPRTGDVLRGLYNQERMKHATDGNWGLYRNTTHQMAEQLERENKLKGALKLYCHVCYYDVNGATNSGGYGPMFDKSLAFLASQVGSILDISKKLGMSRTELKEFFIKESEEIQNKYMPVTPSQGWNEVEKEFKNYK